MVQENKGAKGRGNQVQARRVLHYQLAGKLGTGMATVHKAVDTRLNRIVALKFLVPGGVATDEARKRLMELTPGSLDSDRATEMLALILAHRASQQRDRALARSLAEGLHLPSPPPDQLEAQLMATVQGTLGLAGR